MHRPIDVDDPRHYVIKGQHSHAGDSRKIGKKRVMEKLKTLSKTTKNPTRQVIAQSIHGVKKPTAAVLPSERSLVKSVQRYRASSGVPKNPRSLAELVLPDEYQKTVKGEPFILYDSASDGEIDNRMIIFGTRENLNFLKQCDHIYMDGTFSSVPVLFRQLYTIHGWFLL